MVSFSHWALLIFVKSVKRAFECGEPFRDEVKIYDCGFYGRMPKESLNAINIRSLVEQMGCKTVTEGMDAAVFGYAGFFLAR